MRSPASRSSPSARSPAARLRRASCSPRRFRSTTSKRSPARRSRRRTNSRSTALPLSVRARRRRRFGALVLAEQTLAVPQDEAAALALARGVLSLGPARLPWTKAHQAVARPGHVPAPRRGRGRGRICQTKRWPPIRVARAVSHRENGARRDQRRRPRRRRSTRLLPWDAGATPRRRSADPFPRADRDRGADRLRGRGRADNRAARAGAVRAQRASIARRGTHSPHARAALARPPADPDHPRPARLLARLLGQLSAPTFAAATPAISGPRTPPPPRRPHGRSPGGRGGRSFRPSMRSSPHV